MNIYTPAQLYQLTRVVINTNYCKTHTFISFPCKRLPGHTLLPGPVTIALCRLH